MVDVSVTPKPSCPSALLLMLPFAGYVICISKGVFAPMNPLWISLLFAWTAAATGLAWWLTRGGGDRSLATLDRHASALAIGLIAVAAIVLVSVSVLQARHFAMGMRVVDTAYYGQILWNTLHGDV